MNKVILNEGLDYHDLEDQMLPSVTVDEYSAKMGKDSEIVTLAFTVKSEAAARDLSDWFERGYDFVLDAQVSDGEISPGKFLVFVEMNRRSSVGKRIIELLSDLNTLTNIKLTEWVVIVDDEEYDADEHVLKQVITVSPHEYRQEVEDDIDTEDEEDSKEEENVDTNDEESGDTDADVAADEADDLNEMRVRSGLDPVSNYGEPDAELKAFKAMAGL